MVSLSELHTPQFLALNCYFSSSLSHIPSSLLLSTDDKPVILVLMHHTREVKCTAPMRTWQSHHEVVLHVNVFYHETRGLLSCDENNRAVCDIKMKLLEYKRSIDTSGNFLGVDAECGGTGSTAGGNNRGYFFWRGK